MFLFLDTETTGLPKYSATDPVEKWPRVVQLAWSLYDSDGNRECRNSFIIYPTDFSIPADSARIHGITTDRAKAEGVSLFKVLPQFNADVEKAETVVAHNLDFDLPIVTTEFLRCRLETGLGEKHCFCTMKTPQVVSWCKLPFKVRPGIQVADLERTAPPAVPGRIHVQPYAGADVEACARCNF
jgi:DNA polymerase III epsilon subunit-like protein